MTYPFLLYRKSNKRTFKSTTQILREMSDAWEDMTDIERASALELMGGKRQANILASVITNFETVEDVITASMNSSGSALAENEKWLDSIEGKTYQFTNALQTMWNNLIDSETIKSFIDFGTAAIKILDNGSVQVIALVSALKLAASFKGFSLGGIVEGLSNTINKVTTAQQTLQALSETTKINTGYDLTNITAYAQAVQGLTAKQQANLLAYQGLNQEQIKYAMTLNQVDEASMREAMAHTYAVSAKQQEVISDEQLIQQKAKLVAASLQTQAAVDGEARSKELQTVANILESATTEELTRDKLIEKMTSEGVSAATQAETLAKLGLTGANRGLAASIKAIYTVNPIGFWMTVASTVLSLIPIISTFVGKFKKSAKEIKQEAEEISKAYNDTVDEVKNNLKTLGASDTDSIESLEKEFAELTAGVDRYGNNLSLTSDEYERYKDICSKIVDINPKIASGYDSATKAIGNNASALSDLIELQKTQQRLAVQEMLSSSNIETLAKNIKNDATKAIQDAGVSKVKKKNELFEMLDQGSKRETIDYILSSLGYSDQEIIDELNNFYLSDTDDFDEFSFMSKFIDEILENSENFNGYESKLDRFYSEYNSILESYGDKTEEVRNSLIDTLLQVPYGEESYYKLDDTSKSFIAEWIKNSEMFKIDPKATDEEIEKQLNDNIDTIQNLVGLFADENTKAIIGELEKIDKSDITARGYLDSFRNVALTIWESIGGENNAYGFTSSNDILKMLGIDVDAELNAWNNAIKSIQGYLGDQAIASNNFNYQTMTRQEMNAFLGIDWNAIGAENINSVQDVWDRIKKAIGDYGDTVHTYSDLSESVSSYTDILAQTQEILSDNTKVTQEYKDSLIELGISEEELSEYFDDVNPLIVKNADGLNKLVKEANKNVGANIKLAKSHARLKYYDLVKQLKSALYGISAVDEATKNSVYSTLDQIDAVEKALHQYQLLEDTLLGVNNAFDEFAKAQEIDSMNTYGDSYVEMAQTMYDALYKTGKVGTEAFWSSVESLVPTDVYQHLTDDADRMKAIYDYYNKNILPSLRLDKDELSLDNDAIQEFVKKGIDAGVFEGNKDDLSKFNLVEGMNLEEASKLLGITKAQAYALFAELDKYNTAGNEHSFLSQLDDSTEGKITNITNELEDLNRQKLALLEKGDYNANSAAIADINKQIKQCESELKALGQQAYDTWQQYTQNDVVIAALSKIEDKTETLTENGAIALGLDWDEVKGQTVQQILDNLLAKQLQLEEPTILTAQLAIENIDARIAELENTINKNDFSNIDPISLGLTVDATPEAIKEAVETELASLKEDKVVIATTFGIELTEEEKEALQDELNAIEEFKINDKTFVVSAEGVSDTNEKLQSVKDMLDGIKNKTVVLTTTTYDRTKKQKWDSGTQSWVDAEVNGTAHANGSWGAPKTETALVGELGPEMLVRNGRWTTVGDNGAEFTQVKKGDIIFNHKQTEDLLSKGYVTGRGKLKGGNAFASGTAYSGTWNPTSPDTEQSNKPGKDFSDTGNKLFNAANALSDAADAISNSSDEFSEVFDWVEVRLEEINEAISLSSAKLENAIGSIKKNAIIDSMIDLNQKLYDNLIAGADKYYAFAEKLLAKVPEEYREAAQDGVIAIEAFVGEVDEKTLDAIKEYREWVQKGADATQQAEETLTEVSSLAKQAIDNIASQFENEASLRANRYDQLEAYNALLETTYGSESESIYKALIEANKVNIDTLAQQRKAMQDELDEQVEAGNIEKYSQDWYDAINDIAALDTEIIELTAELNNLQDSINEIHWYHFDLLMSQFEAIADEASNLIDILQTKDVVDEMGNWTDEGITALGLYAQQMEIAEAQAKQYQQEIDYLNENWQALGYTEEEYLEKLEELKSGQYDAIKSYNDTKDAIADLNSERIDAVKEGIQKEIDAYSELIEKKKEELDAEKDLFDFQKSIMEQEKDIADLERQLAALSGDNSASARAKRAQLEAELAEARAALDESYYERSMQNQQEALDKELENFQEEKDKEIEGWEEYLENTEQVVADSLATVQANTDVVLQTLAEMGQEYGLSISEALTSPWEDGSFAIQSYTEVFGDAVSSTIEELEKLKEKFDELHGQVEDSGSGYVDQATDNSEEYQSATYQEPKVDEPAQDNSKQDEPAPSLAKGSHIEVKPGTKWYANSYGEGKSGTAKSGTIKYVNEKGSHPYNIDGLGWIKKTDIKGYAKGSKGVSKDQWALIDELQEELVLRAHNGRLTYMEKGTGVIPGDLTSNLMEWGKLDPSIMLDQNKPQAKIHPEIHSTQIQIDNSIGELIHIDNCSTETLPDVKKIVNDALEKHTQRLNQSLRKYTR